MTTGRSVNWRVLPGVVGVKNSKDLSVAGSAESLENKEESFLTASLSGVFDEAFDIYKQNFLPIFLLMAVVYFPLQIVLHGAVNTWLVPIIHSAENADTPDIVSGMILVFGLLFTGLPEAAVPGLATLLCMTLLSGPLCILISNIYHGSPMSIINAFRACRRHYFKLVISWTVTALAFVGILITSFGIVSTLFFFIAIIFQGNLPNAVSVVILLLMLLIPYLTGCAMAAKWYIFTTPLIVLEGQPISKVPARNSQLTDSAPFRQNWLAAISLPLITYGLLLLLMFSIDSITRLFHLTAGAEFVVQTGLANFIFLFFQPFWMIFLTLLYYNYRAKSEGLDIFQLVEILPASDMPKRIELVIGTSPSRMPPILPAPPKLPAPKIPQLPGQLPISGSNRGESPFVIPPMPTRNENPPAEELP